MCQSGNSKCRVNVGLPYNHAAVEAGTARELIVGFVFYKHIYLKITSLKSHIFSTTHVLMRHTTPHNHHFRPYFLFYGQTDPTCFPSLSCCVSSLTWILEGNMPNRVFWKELTYWQTLNLLHINLQKIFLKKKKKKTIAKKSAVSDFTSSRKCVMHRNSDQGVTPPPRLQFPMNLSEGDNISVYIGVFLK